MIWVHWNITTVCSTWWHYGTLCSVGSCITWLFCRFWLLFIVNCIYGWAQEMSQLSRDDRTACLLCRGWHIAKLPPHDVQQNFEPWSEWSVCLWEVKRAVCLCEVKHSAKLIIMPHLSWYLTRVKWNCTQFWSILTVLLYTQWKMYKKTISTWTCLSLHIYHKMIMFNSPAEVADIGTSMWKACNFLTN